MSGIKKNIILSMTSQAIYFVIPLVLIPILTSNLGAQGYGRVVLIQSYVAIGTMLIDWSYSWIATKEIASAKTHFEKNIIFQTAWLGQILLMGASIFIFLILSVCGILDISNAEVVLVIALLVAHTLFPIWMHQGIEDIAFSSAIIIIQRFFLLSLTYFLLNDQRDCVYYLSLLTLTQIFAGLLSIWRIKKQGYWLVGATPLINIINYIRKNSDLFVARLSISTYTTLIPIAIGGILGDGAVGIYGLADKIRLAAQSVISPITQTLFPRMSRLFSADRMSAVSFLKMSSIMIVLLSSIISMTLFLFAHPLIEFFGRGKFGGAEIILKILSPLPAIISISNIFGVQILLANGLVRDFSKIVITCAFFGAPTIIISIFKLGIIGGAAITIILELIIAVYMFFFVLNKFGVGFRKFQ